MKIDLAHALQTERSSGGAARASWSGPKAIEVDSDRFLGAVAQAAATVMGQNLHRGIRPDGAGPMPGREKDGRPRGLGSLIALRLTGRQIGAAGWLIAPDREIPGHLARILREVPFRPPSFRALETPIHMAFAKAVRFVA